MNRSIVVIGIVGLLIAAGLLAELVIDAVRHRQWIDIPLALAVVGATVWVLIEYGDRILR